MNTPPTEPENLLRDILHDESYAKFRADLHRATAAEFQKRAPSHSCSWLGLAALFIILGAAVALLFPIPLPSTDISEASIPSVALNSADSPVPSLFVLSKPLAQEKIVRSRPLRGLEISSKDSVALVSPRAPQLVETSSARPVRYITDAELHASFSGRPSGFAYSPTGEKVFLLFDPPGQASGNSRN